MIDNKPNLQIVTFNAPVNEKLVTFLEGLLKDAKEGKINQIISILGYSDGAVGHGWSITGADSLRIVGEIECTKYDYMMKTVEM